MFQITRESPARQEPMKLFKPVTSQSAWEPCQSSPHYPTKPWPLAISWSSRTSPVMPTGPLLSFSTVSSEHFCSSVPLSVCLGFHQNNLQFKEHLCNSSPGSWKHVEIICPGFFPTNVLQALELMVSTPTLSFVPKTAPNLGSETSALSSPKFCAHFALHIPSALKTHHTVYLMCHLPLCHFSITVLSPAPIHKAPAPHLT